MNIKYNIGFYIKKLKKMQQNNRVLSVMLFLLMSCNNSETQKERTDQQLDKYQNLLKNNLIDSCIKETTEFVEIFRDNDRAYTILGQAYNLINNDSLARTNFLNAIIINKNNIEALTGYAIVLDKDYQYIAAGDFYRQALFISPYFYPAVSNYAYNRLQANDCKNAVLFGERAVSMKQNTPDMAALCLSYYSCDNSTKGDSLFTLLKMKNYKSLDKLTNAINKYNKQ